MSRPIRTVTLNPALDQTIQLDALVRGQVHRAQAVRFDPGGKGVNVASCLSDWNLATVATGLLGADNAAPFETLFAAKGIEDRFVRVPGETRTNIKLLEISGDGVTTDINLPGPFVGRAALDQVRAQFTTVVEGDIVVLSGSLPASLPHDTYRDISRDLRTAGARVILDASGPALAEVLTASQDALPFCIKPNRHELEAWVGRPLEEPAAVLAAARSLLGLGMSLVVVSLGVQGALFVSGEGFLHAAPPALERGSSVGAGDAMVAGLAAALTAASDLEATARLATAFAAGKLRHSGAHLPDRETILGLAALTEITQALAWAGSAPARATTH